MSQETTDAGARGRSRVRLTDMVEDKPHVPSGQWVSREALVKILVLGGLFVAMQLWQLKTMVSIWRHDPDWAHGFLIPLFSLYLLYIRRDQLVALRPKPAWLGLALLVISIPLAAVAYYPIRVMWLAHLSMLLGLIGLILFMGGWSVLRATWVPAVFLIFAMPLPARLYGMISLPLQNLAASSAGGLLSAAGVQIESQASHLTLWSQTNVRHELTVAEACSGMKMLMAFLALGVAMAYIDRRPNWQRIVLIAISVPVAVLVNILRVTITASMFVIDKPEMGQKFMHEFTGMLMLPPALAMLWLVGILLDRLITEDDEGEQASPASDGPQPAQEGG